MIISKTRIRSLTPYTKRIQQGNSIVLSVQCSGENVQKAINVGFTSDLESGERVLPKAVGKITKFNAEGKDIVLDDQPKETHYRMQEWTWKEFRGRYDFEEKSKIVEIPYQRYPRQFINPPSVELNLVSTTVGDKLVASDVIDFLPENEEMILHVVNLFLEMFGSCEIREENLQSIIKAPIKRLNWDVLPQGRKPWGELKTLVSKVTESLSSGNKVVIDRRLEALNTYEPDFVAIGMAGFFGYLIFGFPQKNLYVLESTQTNNATYILDDNWQKISGLTKSEILNNNLHTARVIHRENWFNEIHKLLSY